MVTETEQKQIPDLESALQQAVERLTTYVSAVPKDRLRGHQVETLEALLNFLRAGNTAGYINSPTGSGKTYLISELSQILGLKTIVLSPTKTILEHTHGVTTSLTPDADITNYYSGDKKLTGQTINTTYQSLPALLESGLLDPSEIGLLICDEAHMALGEQRHKIYQQIPQALMIGLTATPYFGHLEGYRRRGMISNERWTELFTNQIHEISLEEGMERDILAPADVRLIKTAASVDNISISQGDYNKSQLERHLNIEARNWLTVAMVAGLDKLPEHIQISEEKRAEIESIYQEIKDKNGIAIFGLSIEHVEKLAQMLRNSGIPSTFSVHGKTQNEARRDILKRYENGDIKVVLGVDMLSVGWDSPRTQVGIFLAPTQSAIVLLQQFGRILRPNPEIGKDRAIAIQLIDDFKRASQAPILISNLFDPEYLLRGTATGEQPSVGSGSGGKRKPIVTFSGLDITSIIERARSQELLKNRFKSSSLKEISDLYDHLIDPIQHQYPQIGAHTLYRMVLDSLPQRMPSEAQAMVLQGLASIDTNAQHWAKRALQLMSLGVIFNFIDLVNSNSEEEKDEMVHAALSALAENVDKIRPGKTPLYQQVYRIIQEALPNKSMDEIQIIPIDPHVYYPPEETDPVNLSIRTDLRDTLERALDSLTNRERKVIEQRFGVGLYYDRTRTLAEVGKQFGVGMEAIRGIEARTLRKLRGDEIKDLLKDFLGGEETEGIIAFPSETRSRALIGKSSPISFSPQLINPEFMDLNAQLKFQIKNLEINEESKGILAAAGIKYIWEVFATPPEELFFKTEGGFRYRDSSLSRAAAKLFEAKLDPLYESVIDWHYHSPSEDERELTKMVMMAVYYRDKKLFDVSSFGQKLVNPDQAQDWINSQAFKSDFLLSLNFRREYWKVDQWLIRDNQSKD